MATSIFKEISLGGTLGVTFIGVCVSSMLYGVTCLQTFTYYRSAKAKNDGWLLWSLVAALLAFDSAHQAVVIHAVYNYLVLDFANPFKVINLVWSIPTEVVLNAILALILNGFLTFRLWKLSTRYYLTAIAATLSIGNFGTNLPYAIRGFQYNNIFAAETILRTQGIAGLCISVTTEAMISFSLAYYLHRRRTGLRKSNDIITKLIALTVTTGMLTTLFNVADLIAYVTAHDNLYVLFFNFMLGKLYANSLLTSLNSRDYVLGLMGDGSGQGPSDHETLKLPPSSAGSGSSRPRVASPHAAVHIAMDRFVVSDSLSTSATKYESV
ncbi:uncharacterized protein TRAVEDRAFT_29797 [Trametes versicolor FP-101664 SS1]|uniref:uncharacterized protein n=1 Tax=Trametes versicolor (strain FP-101664) TaxID=717944 RepID=UPI0004622759|nr:uncharacterized protein TRAVEDRAFT_29797 [Trametes versicolor FP-101664 SS1]EIW57884.1 hypothetical protein TRAVEDRAFT_29797 [Trametes versicolor FP-101664 SS1]